MTLTLVMVETSDPEISGGLNSNISRSFADSSAAGIMALAGGKAAPDWPVVWMYWRDFGSRYLLQLCQNQSTAKRLEPSPNLDAASLTSLYLSVPPMPGAEYCNPDILAGIWRDLDSWTLASIARDPDGLAGFLRRHAPAWRQVGRVCFHLAEN
ncbi:MAG TPA: ATP-dependent helicase, partial [Pelovirga sp.]|nr:ATP-dependent helicase [Pelovirga sp.]